LPVVLRLYDYYLYQGIEIEIDSCDEQPALAIDAHMLRQVWTQLLLNSIYGMNRKGQLHIRFEHDAAYLQVIWQDNGSMPEDLKAAFEPGTSLRQTEPPIDLWLCKEFVEREAGGKARVTIPDEGGLVVHLEIPLE